MSNKLDRAALPPSSPSAFSHPPSGEGLLETGAGHSYGTKHFIVQRLTAIAAVPLSVVAFCLAARGFLAPYNKALAMVQNPFIFLGCSFFGIVGLIHMKVGMDVILTDYVRKPMRRLCVLIKNAFFCWFMFGLMMYSLVKIMLTTAS